LNILHSYRNGFEIYVNRDKSSACAWYRFSLLVEVLKINTHKNSTNWVRNNWGTWAMLVCCLEMALPGNYKYICLLGKKKKVTKNEKKKFYTQNI